MYSWSSWAIHQLFFPPRLEVVVQQQQSNCLASDGGNQFPLHRLLRDEPDGPASETIRRIGADHRYNPLALTGVQGRFAAWSRKVNQCALQASIAVSPTDIAHSLRGDPDGPCHGRRRLAFVKQQQRPSPLHHSNGLDAAAQQRAHFIQFAGWKFDDESSIRTHNPA